MLNGWTTRTAKELDSTIETWGEMLNHYDIPAKCYPELYAMAFDRRQEVLRIKGDVIQMDAALLVSCWTGEYGLKAQLREREIAAGRTLTEQAPSQCTRCFGTGMETVYVNGKAVGVRPGCKHELLDESDTSAEGLDDMLDKLRREDVSEPERETALKICSRIRAELAHDYVTAGGDQAKVQAAWQASRIMAHVEKYCRENPG